MQETEQMLARGGWKEGRGNQTLDRGQWVSLSADKKHSVKGGREERKTCTYNARKKKTNKPVCLQWPGKLFKGTAFLSKDNRNGVRGR